MGYDMKWKTSDPAEAEAVSELRAVFRAACDARDKLTRGTGQHDRAQDRVLAALKEMNAAEKSYFRLNVWGMARFCSLMERMGMAFEDDPHPEWPEAKDYGTTWDDVDAAKYPEDYPGYEWTGERLRAARACIEAGDKVLSWHGRADTPGIPLHKFSTNDGWHVLPAECEAAVRAWREHAEGNAGAAAVIGKDMDRWLEWTGYLAGAARHGGFIVL
jgi:hypothetical protein